MRAKASGFAVRNHDGSLVGGRTWGGDSFDLIATYGRGARASVPEGGASYNRGRLEFELYRSGGSWKERLVLPLDLEQYLYGLGEMPSSWSVAALRAQAVAGRTFATSRVRRSAPGAQCNCDITDGTNDQVYIGFNKEGGTDGNRWVAAVNDTRGQVVTHRGNVIQAFYAASDGGHSDAVEDVWHGGNDAYAVPYLKAECDPGEDIAANPWTDWQKSYTAGELTNRLAPYTGSIGTVRGFPRVRRGDGGRIITATVRGSNGSASITGSELRWAIGAWDGRIWINKDKNIAGPIRDRYDALMCRPGLPTSRIERVEGGSRQRFENGAIFRNGGQGVTVWLRGAIYREYKAVKGPKSRLGMPTGQIVDVGAGTRALFERGRILAQVGRPGPTRSGVACWASTSIATGPTGRSASRRAGCAATGTVGRSPTSSTARSSAPTRSRVESPDPAGAVGSAVVGGVGLGSVRRAGERLDEAVGDRRGLVGRDRAGAGLQLIPRGQRHRRALGQPVVGGRDGHRRRSVATPFRASATSGETAPSPSARKYSITPACSRKCTAAGSLPIG